MPNGHYLPVSSGVPEMEESDPQYQNRPQSSSIHYEQPEWSQYNTLSYNELENSETEEDMYEYASPAPLDYEVPDQSSETVPDNQSHDPLPVIPPREAIRPPSHPPPILPGRETIDATGTREKEGLALHRLYTALTHAHVPSVYSTPSHSMEFRTNAAVSESTLNIVNLNYDNATSPSTPLPVQTDSLSLPQDLKRHSRARAAILVLLLAAVVVGVVSLAVSVVAMFVTRGAGSGGDNPMEELISLQDEVQQLQRSVELAVNQTSGSVDLSSLYENCEREVSRTECSPEQGLSEGFSCLTDPQPLDIEVCVCVCACMYVCAWCVCMHVCVCMVCVYSYTHLYKVIVSKQSAHQKHPFQQYLVVKIERVCLVIIFLSAIQGYLTLDRTCYVIGSSHYSVTTTLVSSDRGASVHCDCLVREGLLVSTPADEDKGVECVLTMLRCPLQQKLNVTLGI